MSLSFLGIFSEVQEIKEEKRIGSSDPATVNNASTFKQSNSSSFELSNVEVESVGSGRRSSDTDTDTDSDSDYSSHEGDDFFFLTSEMNHGDYDPNEALEKVRWCKEWIDFYNCIILNIDKNNVAFFYGSTFFYHFYKL